MLVPLREQQHATLAHELNNFRIRLKYTLAGEVLNFRREAAGVIDRAIDFES